MFNFFLSVANIAGESSTFVIALDLTWDQCITMMQNWQATIDAHSTIACIPQKGTS